VGYRTFTDGDLETDMILISRRRWIMGGTRYHARGSDEKGNVANCIEKEMIVLRHQKIDKSKFDES